MREPAILDGNPLFSRPLGIVSPCFPSLDSIAIPLSEALHSGQLTNHSRYVPLFEEALISRLETSYAIAVANGTIGLILALKVFKSPGVIILPAFTFSASAHALYWSGHKPVFVDILPDNCI